MGALEQVTKMRKEGRSDQDIIYELKRQKFSPRDINEALNHAQIKNAVGDIQGESFDNVPSPAEPYSPEQTGGYGGDQYTSEDYSQQGYAPSTQQQTYAAQQPQEYYPQEGYSAGGADPYSVYQPGANSNNVIEISEQVFNEKINPIKNKVEDMDEFKALAQTKIDHLSERLKRIESIIDKLQTAILEKIGSYGKNLENIKDEMAMMQDSFSKTLPKLAEKKHKTHSSKKN